MRLNDGVEKWLVFAGYEEGQFVAGVFGIELFFLRFFQAVPTGEEAKLCPAAIGDECAQQAVGLVEGVDHLQAGAGRVFQDKFLACLQQGDTLLLGGPGGGVEAGGEPEITAGQGHRRQIERDRYGGERVDHHHLHPGMATQQGARDGQFTLRIGCQIDESHRGFGQEVEVG